jgi:glutathione synthase/RimK-type ligase-like ATP-grasp enzyme
MIQKCVAQEMAHAVYHLVDTMNIARYRNTNMRVRIFPFKMGSMSAKAIKDGLKDSLNTLLVRAEGRYKPRQRDIIINWGNSTSPKWLNTNVHFTVLNKPNSVSKAINKLQTFEELSSQDVPTVDYTSNERDVRDWISEGETVIGRQKVNGSRGDGIVVITDSENIPQLPLYTKLIPKAREYRVHVFNGEVIDIQQKRRRKVEEGEEVQDGVIKNVAHGWVFCRDDITPPPTDIHEVAIRAVRALGLDFGGVDILSKNDSCYVLEVNSAVGLEGSTLTSYINAIKKYATDHRGFIGG